MRVLKNELKNKKIDYKKLVDYGFKKHENKYSYKTTIKDGQFEMNVSVLNDEITSRLIDLANEEEYVLVDIEGVSGEFVGTVKEEYEKKLNDIIDKCTNIEVFKSEQSKKVIEYIKEKYNDDLEFLWEKFDGTAIIRNKQNEKWYFLIMKISKSKLGIESEEIVEAVDLRYQKEEISNIIDNKEIYPGYHMNKKSWITLILDESVDLERIYELVNNSYNLSLNGKKKNRGKYEEEN